MDVSSFLGGNYLGQIDLPQPSQTCTIVNVDQQLVGQGTNAEQKICILLKEFESKWLVLNKTNLTRLADIYSTDASQWNNKQVLVYRSTTTYASKVTKCIRICGPNQPPPDPLCDQRGNVVPYPPSASPTPIAPVPPAVPGTPPGAAPTQEPSSRTPWEANENNDNPAGV